jgi:hypothetical protein
VVVNTNESKIYPLDFLIGKNPYTYETNKIVLGSCGSDYQIPTYAFNANNDSQFDLFLTFNTYYLRFKMCNTSLCNNISFVSSLYNESSTCEQNKYVPADDNVFQRKLIDNGPSVQKCYFCQDCELTDIGQIQYCNGSSFQNFSFNMNSACQVNKKLSFKLLK